MRSDQYVLELFLSVFYPVTMDEAPPNKYAGTKGRGAQSDWAPTRFALPERINDGDWLDYGAMEDDIVPLRTQVSIEHPKTIISRNRSPDVPFDRSINPYRGCEHGCIYCFARPSHAYHDLSPGLDFETKLFAKPDAATLLRAELAKKSYRVAPIAFGTNTDPYQPIEGKWRIMRSLLELLQQVSHPLTITTKSDRVTRDIDILTEMAQRRLVFVCVSVTTLDPDTHRRLEPRAPRPAKRLEAIRRLSAAGIPTHVNVAPVIPAITDHEMEAIIEAAADAGAQSASFIAVRLPYEVAPLFREWLGIHYPDRAGKVMAIIQSLRGGRDNDPRFGERMRGQGVWGDLLRTRFRRACKAHGLGRASVKLRTDLFCPPSIDGQMRLL